MTYLVKRNQVYYFRLRVPANLVGLFGGHKEILRSLKTSRYKQAQQRCAILSEKAERLLSISRSSMFSDDEVKKKVAIFISEQLRGFEEWRFDETPDAESVEWDSMPLQDLEKVRNGFQSELAARQYGRYDRLLSVFIAANHLDVAKGTPEYHRMARHLLTGFADFLRIEIERRKGNYANEFDSVLKNNMPQPDAAEKKVEAVGPVITEIVQAYFAEKESGERWDIKTKQQNESSLTLMVEILGDRPATSVNHQELMKMREVIRQLPANRNKSPAYRNRPIADVLEMKHIKPMSLTTVNNIINRIVCFWNWAETHDYVTKSPARHLLLPTSKRADEQRSIYDPSELQKMLDAIAKECQPAAHPERVWITLIAMHSGMRPNEIAQLYLDDVVEEGGVFSLRVNDTHSDQRVKNKNARRFVPVHPVVVDLGFRKYFAKVEPNVTKRLFPKLKPHRDGYFTYLGRWFRDINRNHVTTDKDKVFYSLRHNAATALKQARVEPYLIAEILGHSVPGETMERYGKRYEPAILLDAIKRIDYGLDLTNIRDAASKTF